jgi:hypothetical protein
MLVLFPSTFQFHDGRRGCSPVCKFYEHKLEDLSPEDVSDSHKIITGANCWMMELIP